MLYFCLILCLCYPCIIFQIFVISRQCYILKIFEHQHHMGLLILEKKELASKYEQIKASAEAAELLQKHDQASHLSAIAEARKREESLKKTLGVEKECIASVRYHQDHCLVEVNCLFPHFPTIFFFFFHLLPGFCSLRRPCMKYVQNLPKRRLQLTVNLLKHAVW